MKIDKYTQDSRDYIRGYYVGYTALPEDSKSLAFKMGVVDGKGDSAMALPSFVTPGALVLAKLNITGLVIGYVEFNNPTSDGLYYVTFKGDEVAETQWKWSGFSWDRI